MSEQSINFYKHKNLKQTKMEKTPIAEAIEKICEHEKMHDYAISTESMRIILQELLPKEKEMVEKAYDDGFNSYEFNYFQKANEYFNENYTQK